MKPVQRSVSTAGRELSKRQREQLGSAIHWATGIGSVAAYGLLRRRLSGHGLGRNLAMAALFGSAVWLILDEAANPVLGLTPRPAAFPWQTHARGLAGHLVLGLAAEGLMQAADRVA